MFSTCAKFEHNTSFITDLQELILLKGVTSNDLLESYTELQGVQLVTKQEEEGE
jgi:hypothetical protein